MKTKTRNILLALGVLAANSLPVSAEDREWIPYKKLLEITYLDKFYDAPLSQRDRVRMRGYMSPKNKAIKPSDVVFTIMHAEGKERIQVNADGTFDLAPNPKFVKENPMVFTNMPKGEKAGFGFNAYAILPEGLQFGYAALMAGVKQGNDLVKAQAGVLRFLAPKFTGVELHFAKPAQQTMRIAMKDGAKIFTADAKGELKLKLDETLMKDNPQVVLSEHPIEVEVSIE